MRGFLRWVALAVGALFVLFLALAGLNASFWFAYTAPTILLASNAVCTTRSAMFATTPTVCQRSSALDAVSVRESASTSSKISRAVSKLKPCLRS